MFVLIVPITLNSYRKIEAMKKFLPALGLLLANVALTMEIPNPKNLEGLKTCVENLKNPNSSSSKCFGEMCLLFTDEVKLFKQVIRISRELVDLLNSNSRADMRNGTFQKKLEELDSKTRIFQEKTTNDQWGEFCLQPIHEVDKFQRTFNNLMDSIEPLKNEFIFLRNNKAKNRLDELSSMLNTLGAYIQALRLDIQDDLEKNLRQKI
jgi:hypothetical protein